MFLIGITGLAGSGKDTAGGFLRELGYERVSFADTLKELALRINPLVEWKDLEEPWRLSDAIDTFGANEAKFQVPEVRRFYQALGNEAREVLGDTVWLDAWQRRVAIGGKVVVTDVRYPNEADLIRSLGGIVIRVNRTGAGLSGEAGTHPSETGVLEIRPDYDIQNDDRLEDLQRTVLVIADDYQLRHPWKAA